MKYVIGLMSSFLLYSTIVSADTVRIKSPNNEIVAAVSASEKGAITYTLIFEGEPILNESALGITIDGVALGKDSAIVEVNRSSFKKTYVTRGNHSLAHNHYNEVRLTLKDRASKAFYHIVIRVFDDGVAYRYIVPGDGVRRIDGEHSSWHFIDNCTIWYQNDLGCYEGIYRQAMLADAKKGEKAGPPLTVKLPRNKGYVCLTEGNLVNYSGAALRFIGNNAVQVSIYGGWRTTGAITTPWRLTIVSRDLNGLVNTDMVKNVCPPAAPELRDASWIKPGRSVWSWWSSNTVPPPEQKKYADMAAKLGFEYNLIDWKWEKWPKKWKTLADVVKYSKEKGVDVWVWKHSKELKDTQKRRAFFDKLVQADVVGVKIDFFPTETAKTVAYYEDILKDAAESNLMVNFHGANKPTGRSRTWPHEMTREGIRGHEYHRKGLYQMSPEHDTILPFTRFIAGHGDYTPTAFDPKRLKGFSWAHELAQAIVFTSPVIHFADNPKYFVTNPAFDVLKSIPSVWDETIVLPGSSIGKVAALARRSGRTWFIGILNGPKESHISIDLHFLGKNSFDAILLHDDASKPDAFDRQERELSSRDRLSVKLRERGGFVACFRAR